jgi:hypothetical protein
VEGDLRKVGLMIYENVKLYCFWQSGLFKMDNFKERLPQPTSIKLNNLFV